MAKWEETHFKKTIVIAGLILLIIGVAVAVSSIRESYTQETNVETWNIWPPTLEPPPNPQNQTFWGRLMRRGMWFQLNISSSDEIRVVISVLEQETQTKEPIYNASGAGFTQKVTVGGTGTYQVDIINEKQYPVNISGNVTAWENVPKYRIIYPYNTPGTLLALVGLVTLIFGALTKPKKSLKHRKDKQRSRFER